MIFMNGSLPVKVQAFSMSDPSGLDDTLNISLAFENGSIGTIAYYANGSKSLSKEYIEVYRAGLTAVLTDFRDLKIYGKGRVDRKKLMNQDKGQKPMVSGFIDAATRNAEAPIPFSEIEATTRATFRVLESLRTGLSVDI